MQCVFLKLMAGEMTTGEKKLVQELFLFMKVKEYFTSRMFFLMGF